MALRRLTTVALVIAIAVTTGYLGASGQPPSLAHDDVSRAGGSSCESPDQGHQPGRTRPRGSVLAVSVDGLRPATIRQLGPRRAPALHRLIRTGASTLDARTAVEMTVTLPNHASMVTGRPITGRPGGHGVTMNADPGDTVHALAGEHVSSMFEVTARHGGRPAMFVSKSKFALLQRSWACDIAAYTHREDSPGLTRLLLADLRTQTRALRFVHYADPDRAGHQHGFTSRQYQASVRRVDRQLGRLMSQVSKHPRLRAQTTMLLTSDHGGSGTHHDERTDPQHFTIPFLAWGRGVSRGADLYRLNPDRRAPGRAATDYVGRQPIRNGDLANLVTDLLNLPPVPGSRLNQHQGLDLR